MLCTAKLDGSLDPVDAAKLLEDTRIDSPTETDEPHAQTDHAKCSVDKSEALGIYSS